MFIRVIIPVLNEAKNLQELLPMLRTELRDKGEVIVSDGGSTDASEQVTKANGCTFFPSPSPGRGPQMNAAVAAFPDADIFYFVHADTRPPKGFYRDILTGVKNGYPVGCYRFQFDTFHPLLAINAFCTRFNALPCRGGDQSLYVSKKTFQELNGFGENMRIMEDYEFIERAQAQYPFRIIPRNIRVSARKYRANSWIKVQMANFKVFRMYRKGAEQQEMIDTYQRMLKPW